MALSITVLQHANAVATQSSGNSSDQARTLSPKGRSQALARSQTFGDMKFHFIISSPVLRAVETAQIIGNDQPVIIDSLSPYQDEVMDNLFAKLGYDASLSIYRQEDGGVFDQIAGQAWQDIRAAITAAAQEAQVTDFDDFNVLVVGHAVATNALGCAMLGGRNNDKLISPGEAAAQDRLAELPLGEAEGFTIVFDDEGLITLEIHH